MSWFYIFTLGFAVSFDAMAAGIAYDIKSIRIPLNSLIIIGLVTCLCSGVAMLFAYSADTFISDSLAIALGAFVLVMLGILYILQELLAKKITMYSMNNQLDNQANKSENHILRIMIQPENADIDHSKSISEIEAACLGAALGVDNAVATFGAYLSSGYLPLYTPLIMAVIQILFITTGYWLSSKFTSPILKQKAPYLSGIILILLGLSRLL